MDQKQAQALLKQITEQSLSKNSRSTDIASGITNDIAPWDKKKIGMAAYYTVRDKAGQDPSAGVSNYSGRTNDLLNLLLGIQTGWRPDSDIHYSGPMKPTEKPVEAPFIELAKKMQEKK